MTHQAGLRTGIDSSGSFGPSAEAPPVRSVSAPHEAIFAALLYYHLFDFPLTADEAHLLSGDRGSLESSKTAIDWLVDQGLVGRERGYLFLGDAAQVLAREQGAVRAAAANDRILARARLIGRFPFVRGVGLSGSVSKGVIKPGDDIDFFVVASSGRLWICRTLLMLFKKIFLLNSHQMFCVNYLVAEDAMGLPDRNVFTAMEIAWLRPVWGNRWYADFLSSNDWLSAYLPNWQALREPAPCGPAGLFKNGIERSLEGERGDRLDEWLRARIARRNRRRYRHLSDEEFAIAFRSEPHSSKHHPGHHQGRVTSRYQTELEKWRPLLSRLFAVPGGTPST